MKIRDLPDILRLLPDDECRLLQAKYGLIDGVVRSNRAAFDSTYPDLTGRSEPSKTAKVREALARAWIRAILVEFFELIGDYTVAEQPERLMSEFKLAVRVFRLGIKASGRGFEGIVPAFQTLESAEMLYTYCKERDVIAFLRGLGAAHETYRRQRLRVELRQLAQIMIDFFDNLEVNNA